MATLKRHFLGWERTPLELACEWLLGGGGGPNPFDLSGLSIITPGGRVGRMLLGMLVDRAESAGRVLSPPHMSTPGELPEILLGPVVNKAGAVRRRLAWVRALSNCGPQELEALLPRRPDERDQRSWNAIASMLESVHQILIGEGVLFSDVPDAAPNLLGDSEAARWRAAAKIQIAYAEELRSIGQADPGMACLDALKNPNRPVSSGPIVLIGVQELSRVQRRALALAEPAPETLIFAPESLADAFDEFGGVIADAWAERPIAIPDSSILFAKGPDDQAFRAMEAIASLPDRFAPHQISIAAPDDSVIPRIERAAERYAGRRAHAAAGVPLPTTSIFQLLRAIEVFLDGESFEALLALVRHPDLERWLLRSMAMGSPESWLARADKYLRNHVPGPGLDAPLLDSAEADFKKVSRVRDRVRRLLAPLKTSPVDVIAITGMLQTLYAGRMVNRDDPDIGVEIAAAEVIRDAVAEVAGLPAAWRPTTGLAMLRLIVEVVSSKKVPREGATDELEVLGWLEMPMDTAPVAVITGVNDGFLPESFDADALLPDTLRERLGVPSARRRLARDAYLLSLVAHSRPHVRLICGRVSAAGDPLLPSRLLFASDPDSIVRRVRRFAEPQKDSVRVILPRPRINPGASDLFPARPGGPAAVVDSMRVTAFGTFLRCPYQFYLEHVLGLEEVKDQPPEIDPLAFGNLTHEVLEAFGGSDVRDSTDAKKIAGFLRDQLAALAKARFGGAPAVAVQLDVAGARLAEFAVWQAAWRSEGWRIEVVEWKPEGGRAPLLGMSPAFYVRGKIDRIDRNDDGSVAILDYKTAEEAKSPPQTHGKQGVWRDLQLPLYRHLAAALGLPRDPKKLLLAYVNLPGRPGRLGISRADWKQEDLDDADAKAIEVAMRVRRGDWFDLGPDPPDAGTFGALCGTSFMTSLAGAPDEEGGEE